MASSSSAGIEMSVIVLLPLAAVLLLLLFGGAHRSPHAPRFMTGAAVVLAILGVVVFYRLMLQDQQGQMVTQQQIAAMQADFSVSQPFAGSNMYAYSGPMSASVPSDHVMVRWNILGLVILAVVCIVAFKAMRGAARSHEGHSAAGIGAGAVVIGFALFAFATFFSVRVSQPTKVVATVAPPPGYDAPAAVVMTPPMPSTPQEPIDELWDRLNRPRIELSTPTAPSAEAPAGESPIEAQGTSSDHSHDGEAADGSAPDDSRGSDDAEAANGDSEGQGDAAAASHESAEDSTHPTEPAAATEPAPEPKPDWVLHPPKLGGPVREFVVQAGPYSTLNECYEGLREAIQTQVQQRIEELVRAETGNNWANVPPMEYMHLSTDYIVSELLADEYVETVEASFGQTKMAWGLLRFTPDQDNRLLEAWKGYARRDGIAIAIAVSALVLGVVGFIFALLKIDTWTRGYYSKRLFLGVPAAIIAFMLLAALVSAS